MSFVRTIWFYANCSIFLYDIPNFDTKSNKNINATFEVSKKISNAISFNPSSAMILGK